MSENTSTASSDETIEAARVVIARFFPEYQMRAGQMVRRELSAIERVSVIAAGDDKSTARNVIKDIFARAYDRRRDEAAAAAPAELEKDRVQNEQVRQELAGEPAAPEAPQAADSAQPAEAAAPPPAEASPEALPPAVAQSAPEAAAALAPEVPGGTAEHAAAVESPAEPPEA